MKPLNLWTEAAAHSAGHCEVTLSALEMAVQPRRVASIRTPRVYGAIAEEHDNTGLFAAKSRPSRRELAPAAFRVLNVFCFLHT